MSGFSTGDVKKPLWRRVAGFVGLSLATIWMAGCAADGDIAKPRSSVAIGSGVTIKLPRPADLGRNISAVQSIILRFGEKTLLFEARLAVTQGRMLIVGLDTIGRRAITVRWDGRGMETKAAPWLEARLPLRRFVADMVLIYWPDRVVRTSLIGSGGRLTADTSGRTIVNDDGEEIVRIDYVPSQPQAWSGRARYRHLTRGYEIDVRSAEVTK